MIDIQPILAQECPNKALQGIYYDEKGVTAILWTIISGSSKIECMDRLRSPLRDSITRKAHEKYIDKYNFDLINTK